MSDISDICVDVTGVRQMGVRLDEYCGLWAVEPLRFSQMLHSVSRVDLSSHVRANVEAGIKTADIEARGSFDRVTANQGQQDGGDIAVIEISGTLTKRGSSLGAGSSVVARSQIRKATSDNTIAGIMLVIDSPGGTVAGTADLAADVKRAAESKPVYAYIEDLGASAAYWVASQATKVFANNDTALVGSIGTFLGLYDLSGKAEQEGIKAIVIKAGEFKGGGFPGAEISDEQIAIWQESVNATQTHFTSAVASGRGLSLGDAQALVTGRVYMAEEAQRLKLIDGVKTMEETLQELQQSTRTASNKRKAAMSESTNEPVAATYKEIVAACPGIDATQADDAMFIADCQQRELTAKAASAEWCKTLKSRADAARADAEEAKKSAEEAKQSQDKRKGVTTIGTRSDKSSDTAGDADATLAFNRAVTEKVAAGMKRMDAVKAVNREQPELREAMVAAANQK